MRLKNEPFSRICGSEELRQVTPMLLNEMQKQQRVIEALQEQVAGLAEKLAGGEGAEESLLQ